MIEIWKTNLRNDWITHKLEMGNRGTLDSFNAGRLGVHIDIYKFMKNDPRVIKCLDVMDDVHLRSIYAQDEQMYDSEIYGLSILELIEKRKEELVDLQRRVKKNALVLENEYRKKMRGVPKPPRRTKADRDADLSTFIPLDLSKSINRTQLQRAAEQSRVSRETEEMIRIAKVRSEYDEKINFRADVRKIITADIRLAENHESHSKFHVRLTREGDFRDERKSTSVKALGWSELREIGLYFKEKP